MNLNLVTGEVPIILYDMTIENIEERRAKAIEFPTLTKASNFLGYTTRYLSERIRKENGSKVYACHKTTGTKYAVRRKPQNQTA